MKTDNKQLYTYVVFASRSVDENGWPLWSKIGWRKTSKQAAKFADELINWKAVSQSFTYEAVAIMRRPREENDFNSGRETTLIK